MTRCFDCLDKIQDPDDITIRKVEAPTGAIIELPFHPDCPDKQE